jgi:hypothetical protein
MNNRGEEVAKKQLNKKYPIRAFNPSNQSLRYTGSIQFEPVVKFTHLIRAFFTFQMNSSGGYKEMSSILTDQWRPLVYEPKCGGRGELRGVSANENSCTQEPK